LNESLLTALLGCAGTLLGSLGGVLASARLTNYRLAQLEERVKIHNSFSDRLSVIEERCKHHIP